MALDERLDALELVADDDDLEVALVLVAAVAFVEHLQHRRRKRRRERLLDAQLPRAGGPSHRERPADQQAHAQGDEAHHRATGRSMEEMVQQTRW